MGINTLIKTIESSSESSSFTTITGRLIHAKVIDEYNKIHNEWCRKKEHEEFLKKAKIIRKLGDKII